MIERKPRNLIWKVAGGNQARGWEAADLDTAILFSTPCRINDWFYIING